MKKLLALLLAGAMALSMVACGSSEPAASEGGETESAWKKQKQSTTKIQQNSENTSLKEAKSFQDV